jgi:hypothetical protein
MYMPPNSIGPNQKMDLEFRREDDLLCAKAPS